MTKAYIQVRSLDVECFGSVCFHFRVIDLKCWTKSKQDMKIHSNFLVKS